MIKLTNTHWAVEVPDKYAQITIDPVGPVLMWWSYEGIETSIDLPPGTWQIVCTSKEASEEQLKVMDDFLQHNNFKEWFQNFNARLSYYYNRVASLNSMLTSKGCDTKLNYLILKKQ